MIIFSERWGIWVFYIAIAWLFVLFGVLIAGGFPIPDPHKIDRQFHQFVCLWLVLTAASVYVLARYRAASAARRSALQRADAATAAGGRYLPVFTDVVLAIRSYGFGAWAFVASLSTEAS